MEVIQLDKANDAAAYRIGSQIKSVMANSGAAMGEGRLFITPGIFKILTGYGYNRCCFPGMVFENVQVSVFESDREEFFFSPQSYAVELPMESECNFSKSSPYKSL